MEADWVSNFITEEKCFIAWDETQANEIGHFPSYAAAKEAVLEYANTLNKRTAEVYLNNKCPWCGCQLHRNTWGNICTSQHCDFKDYS